MYRVPDWFCCLHPVEQNALRVSAEAWFLSAGTFIPCDVLDVLFQSGVPSGEARRIAFVAIFGLTVGEMVIGEVEEPICVYTYDDADFWSDVLDYVVSPDGACPEGCQIWFPA